MGPFVSQFAIQLIITLIKSMMDNGLVEKVQALVISAFGMEVPGEERKAAVMADLRALGGPLGKAFAETTPWLINMLIEAIVGQYKTGDE